MLFVCASVKTHTVTLTQAQTEFLRIPVNWSPLRLQAQNIHGGAVTLKVKEWPADCEILRDTARMPVQS